jgi:hypothetical protein
MKKTLRLTQISTYQFLEDNRDFIINYFDLSVKKVKWLPWIKFFLEAVRKQTASSLDEVKIIEK